MKSYILATSLILGLAAFGAQAQNTVTVTNYVTITNVVPADVNTSAVSQTNDAPDFNKIDITLGSAGSSYGGTTQAGVDFSVSIDPFENLSSLWVGVSQSVYWAPSFGGSTDVDVDWNISVYGNFYVQPGWSIGDVYGAGVNNLVRTGPELIVQYYLSNDVYVYGQVNYDALTKGSGEGWQTSNTKDDGWRWAVGLGYEF